ncbi:hypothetical protein BaRGS_00023984 [Batillaria attramentaria]|uniref:Meiosis 1 arrest protein n=1 Tax=Batillaria attramentaria TaxID=370345 RepID=A0ABD0KCG9_9CAEN
MAEAHQTQAKTTGRRMLRGHQPARALLFDVSQTVEVKSWRSVLNALQGLLSIVCNFSGPARIPLLTVYLLGDYPEVMLPFSPPKGNLCRMLTALRDVRNSIEESILSASVRPDSCLAQGVAEACGQYRRHLNAIGQLQGGGGVQFQQLEIVVLTGGDQATVRKQLDFDDSSLDMNHIKRLVAALLTSFGADEMESPHSSLSNSRELDDGGLVDFIHLEADDASLQRFFYTWLLDSSSDTEHLHLVLPPPSPVDERLTIKCDLVERIVNPAQLPHQEYTNLHPDSSHCKLVFPCPSKAAGLTVPIHSLSVVGTLPADTVCDSLIFGLPLLAHATSCWRIDWEELEQNAASLHALCQELISKNQVLLAQLQPPDVTHGTRGSNSSSAAQTRSAPPPCPRGLFILLPGANDSLLVKSVATRDLTLPSACPVSGCDVTEDSVPSLDSFNPLSFSSGLVDTLLAQAAPKQQAGRPRPAPKRKASALKVCTCGSCVMRDEMDSWTHFEAQSASNQPNKMKPWRSHSVVHVKRHFRSSSGEATMHRRQGEPIRISLALPAALSLLQSTAELPMDF